MRYKIEKRRCEDGLVYYRGYKLFWFIWIPVTLSNIDKDYVKRQMDL